MTASLSLENNGSPLSLTPNQLQDIEKLAGLGWNLSRVARYLGISYAAIEQDFNSSESTLKYHFMRGMDISQAKIDMALLSTAESGNLTASAIVQKKLSETKYQIRKQQILYGY